MTRGPRSKCRSKGRSVAVEGAVKDGPQLVVKEGGGKWASSASRPATETDAVSIYKRRSGSKHGGMGRCLDRLRSGESARNGANQPGREPDRRLASARRGKARHVCRRVDAHCPRRNCFPLVHSDVQMAIYLLVDVQATALMRERPRVTWARPADRQVAVSIPHHNRTGWLACWRLPRSQR